MTEKKGSCQDIYTFCCGWLRLKSNSLRVFLRGNISADNCVRKLFKPSKHLASLQLKKIIVLDFNVTSKVGFWPFLAAGT